MKTSEICLTLVMLMGGMVNSLSRSSINSFFPLQASKLGIGRMDLGIIFACQPLGKIVIQNILKNIIYRRRRSSIIVGVIVSFSSLVLFSFYENLKDKTLLFLLSIFSRFLLGMGESMFNIPAVTYLQERNQQYNGSGKQSTNFLMKNILGKMEAFLEIGNMAGPILGGTLFQQGGSFAVFLPICGIQLTLLGAFIYSSRKVDQQLKYTIQSTTTLPEIGSQKNNQDLTVNNNLSNVNSSKNPNKNTSSINGDVHNIEDQDYTSVQKNLDQSNISSQQQVQVKQINMLKINLNPKIFLSGVIIFLPLFSQSFIDPTLSLFLEEQFGMNEIEAGYFFFSNALAFIISTSTLTQYYTKNIKSCRFTSIFSLFSKSFAFFMYGPEKIFNIKSHIGISVVCSIVIGFSIGNILVSQNKVLNFIVKRELRDYSREQQLYIISILYNMYQDFGWLSGPLVGGILTEYLEFPRASSIIGLIIISYTVYYLIVFKLPSMVTVFPQKIKVGQANIVSKINDNTEIIIPTFSDVKQKQKCVSSQQSKLMSSHINGFNSNIQSQENSKIHNNKQQQQYQCKLFKNQNIIDNQLADFQKMEKSNQDILQFSNQKQSLLKLINLQSQNELMLEPLSSNRSQSQHLVMGLSSRHQEEGSMQNINLNSISLYRNIDNKNHSTNINQQSINEIKSFEKEELFSPLSLTKKSSRIKRRQFSIVKKEMNENQQICNDNEFNKIFEIKPLGTHDQLRKYQRQNFKKLTLNSTIVLQNIESRTKFIDEDYIQDQYAERSTMCKLDGESTYNPQASQQQLDESYSPTTIRKFNRKQQSMIFKNLSQSRNLMVKFTKVENKTPDKPIQPINRQ